MHTKPFSSYNKLVSEMLFLSFTIYFGSNPLSCSLAQVINVLSFNTPNAKQSSKHDLLICIGSTIFIWHLKVLVISLVLHDSSVKYRRASTKSFYIYIYTHTQSYLRELVEHVNGIGHLQTQKMDFVVVCNVFSYC